MYYLVDAGRGVVAAEVLKAASGDRVVALGPGRYKVKRRLADRLRIGEVQVAPGRFVTPRRIHPARRPVLRRSGQGRAARCAGQPLQY
jgi:hypothetical protein